MRVDEKKMREEIYQIAYGRTLLGQLLYDLCYVNLADKWLARKHHLAIAEIRTLRELASIHRS